MSKSYYYQGTEVSEAEVLEAAASYDMETEDYLETFDFTVEEKPDKIEEEKKPKKEKAGKQKDTQTEDATVVSESSASTSTPSSSESSTEVEPEGEDLKKWYKHFNPEPEGDQGFKREIYDAQRAGDDQLTRQLEKEKKEFDAAVRNGEEYYITRNGEGIKVYDPNENVFEEFTEEIEETEEDIIGVEFPTEDQANVFLEQPEEEEKVESIFEDGDQESIVTKISNGEHVLPVDIGSEAVVLSRDFDDDDKERNQITLLYSTKKGSFK